MAALWQLFSGNSDEAKFAVRVSMACDDALTSDLLDCKSLTHKPATA